MLKREFIPGRIVYQPNEKRAECVVVLEEYEETVKKTTTKTGGKEKIERDVKHSFGHTLYCPDTDGHAGEAAHSVACLVRLAKAKSIDTGKLGDDDKPILISTKEMLTARLDAHKAKKPEKDLTPRRPAATERDPNPRPKALAL